VSFNHAALLQVFEVNIRVLGGLLSAHLLATDPTLGYRIEDYGGELLDMAHDLGERMLSAFYITKHGIPCPYFHLNWSMATCNAQSTNVASVGTLILEFGVLSRLTNDTRFEHVARKAISAIWSHRSKYNLVGNTIGLDTSWIHVYSGVGAGSDSFYEYLLKAYILFDQDEYLQLFRKAYKGLTNYNREISLMAMLNVNMFDLRVMNDLVDGLSAFYPGLLVLHGDLRNAVKLHLLYAQLWFRHSAIPEVFDLTTRNASNAEYILRPEFIESNYFLYRATQDGFYLDVGERIVNDLVQHARTSCGFASYNAHTKKQTNRMHSFFQSETLKYLYLLFDEDHVVNRLDRNAVFSTEAHLLWLPRQYHIPTNKTISRPPTCHVYTDWSASHWFLPEMEWARRLAGYEPEDNYRGWRSQGWCVDLQRQ
jgi:mannosidase alpha-like ER degradation enhancer 1